MEFWYLFVGVALLFIIGFALWRARKDSQSQSKKDISFRR